MRSSETIGGGLSSKSRIVLFVVGLLVCLVALNARIKANRAVHEWDFQYREAFAGKRRFDLLILGSSHAAHGIDPRILEESGRTCYNFAISGGTPDFALDWYRKVFKGEMGWRPREILLGVDWFAFRDDGSKGVGNVRRFEQDSEYFPWSLFLRELLGRGTDRNTLLLNRIPLLKNRSELRVIQRNLNDRSKIDVQREYNGYVPYRPSDFEGSQLVSVRHSDEQVRSFIELVDEICRDGITLVLVETPEYLAGRHVEGDYDRKANDMIRRIAEGRRVPFLNYNGERRSQVNDSEAYFSDWGHLNRDGSKAFTRRLKSDICQLRPS
jgi:hypothetical protein